MKQKLMALLLVLCFANAALADTFTVTSSADSGPGTLRQAITLANSNGTGTTDYIYFNIPQTAFNARIINLDQELPSLTSNMVIDGTTQPGETYAVTQAKICLVKNGYVPQFSMLKIENAENVKIYGLFLYYGYWQGFFVAPYRSHDLYGVNLINAQHIEIGAAGKGNMITGVVHGIYSNSTSCSDVAIRANFLGHTGYYTNNQSLDIDQNIVRSDCGITLANVKDITIGGDLPEDGNVFGSQERAINIDSRFATGNGFIRIRNNWFGRGYDRQQLINIYDFWDAYVNIGRSRNNPVSWTSEGMIDYRVEFLDNDIPSHVNLSYVSDSILIYRNHFDEDFRSNSRECKLGINKCTKGGWIGNDDPSNKNTFKKRRFDNYFPSVWITESGPFTHLKNEFDCNSVYGSTVWVRPVPFVQVDSTSSNFVRGRATANSRIDLYYDDACTACEGKIYMTTVTANSTGNWSYSGSIQGTVIATATTNAGYTSAFSTPMFDIDHRITKNPTCGQHNGSITGITAEGAEAYFWVNLRTHDTVSHTIDLLNAGPGEYLLYGVHGGTCINTTYQSFQLEDWTPQIIRNGMYIGQPTCGQFNGYLSGIVVSYGGQSTYKWIDAQGQTIGTQLNLTGLGPGTYRFVVTDTTQGGGCSDTATFVLTNQSGPTMQIAGAIIKAATCGQSNGAISGITVSNVTGTAFVQWVDSLNRPVGNNLDLSNVPPGNYRLKFKDSGPCDTIRTPVFIIPNNGQIGIDESNKIISPAKCSGTGGSIQNLIVSGAGTYEWRSVTSNTIVGTGNDVFNLPAGNYQLTVRNDFGCSKTSSTLTVPQAAFLPIGPTNVSLSQALCGQDIGKIIINSFSVNGDSYAFHWVDSSSGQTIGTGTTISGLPPGTYYLFARDSNGCEQRIYTGIIQRFPPPVLSTAQIKITDDQCGEGKGGISQLSLSGAVGPTVFTWYDASGNVAGNGLALPNVAAGSYTLHITDAGACNLVSGPYTVGNNDQALPPPVYENLVIPRHSDAALRPQNSAPGTYALYASPTSITPLQQNANGQFSLPDVAGDLTVYVRRTLGSCSSIATPVSIHVVDKSYFAVPTAFTPNGDGLNDALPVRVIGYIELSYFRIYDRWGKLVFETHKLNTAWNGQLNGVLQPGGVYVWVAQGKDITGKVVTDKGSFVLIR